MRKKRGLNRKQEFFCKCFSDPCSDTWHKQAKSAIKAGYSEDTADAKASMLIKQVKVAARIDTLEDEFYIKSRETTPEQVVMNYVHDRDKARESGQYQAAINATTKLGEIGGLFKQRAVIEHVPVETGAEKMTDAERAASIRAAEAYKLHLAVDGDEIEGVRNLVKATTLTKPVEVEQKPQFELEDEPKQSVITERVPAHMVGRGPRKPTRSASGWE